MKHLAECIANFYVKKNIIDVEYKEVYEYGTELILNDIVTFSLILIISNIFWNIRFAVEFLIVFCITRIFCGGFHASKTYICRCTMVIVFCSVCVIAMNISKNNFIILLLILLISFFVLLKLIPVKHPNKNLTEEEKNINKKRGIISYIIFSIASIVAILFDYSIDGFIIALSLSAVSVLVIIGTIFNERGKHNEKNNKENLIKNSRHFFESCKNSIRFSFNGRYIPT